MSTHRERPTWASPEIIRNISLFAAMAAGSFGASNHNIGALDAAVSNLRGEVRSVTTEIAALGQQMDRQGAAIRELRYGTVNPSNLSRIVGITRAIAEMDRDDSSQWTAAGYPRIGIIEKKLKETGRRDYKVTSIERDHACALSDKCRR